MNKPTSEVFDAAALAQIMGTSVQAIRSALHRGMDGKTIPPSILIGNRRRWIRATVYAWVRTKAKTTPPFFHPVTSVAGNSSNPHKEVIAMKKSAAGIFVGRTYKAEDGEEFTVIEIDKDAGQVTVEDKDGDEGVVGLEDMQQAIRDGELSDQSKVDKK